MSIKFEKKVILGSVTSFVVAAIGFIAVFFPDLFNMQKKNIEELVLVLDTKEDAKKLDDFLWKRKEDNKIFKLSLQICRDAELESINKSHDFGGENYIPIYIKYDDEGTLFALDSTHVKYYNPLIDAGIPDEISNSKGCKNSVGVESEIFSGTFLFSDMYYDGRNTMYNVTVSFDSISDKDIKLKDY